MRFYVLNSGVMAFALAAFISGCAAQVVDNDEAASGDGAPVAEAKQELAAEAKNFWIPRFHERQTTVAVCFEAAANWTAAERQSIENLAAMWEFPGGVDFYFHGTCMSSFPGVRIGRSTDGVCTARIGSSGLNVSNGMRLSTATGALCVRRAFGLALGFTLEQERRDSPCTIGRGPAEPDVYLTPYDGNSMLNWCAPYSSSLSLPDVAGLLSIYGGGDTAVTPGKVAIRSARGAYLRYDITAPTPNFWTRDGISIPEQWVIDNGSTSAVTYGQTVTLRTRREGLYINVVNGALRAASYAHAASQWRIYHAMFPTATGTVKVHEPVVIQSSTGLYLSKDPNSNSVRVVGARAGGPSLEDDAWRFHSLPYAP
ncbi:MAG TPA: hypothetical protein VI072_03630 [Polyangiaceae bacterium]